MRFVQQVAEIADPVDSDSALQSSLLRLLGAEGREAVNERLRALVRDAESELRAATLDAEAHPPVLKQFGAWGDRIDEIVTSRGWEVQRQAAARHGMVAVAYDPQIVAQLGAGARVLQHALLYLWAPDSAIFNCPIAMTDGAAALLSFPDVDPALKEIRERLVSWDPEVAWTSGQWMTETEGGSDVGRGSTAAQRQSDGSWQLTGEKWFCSATTAEISVALARPEGRPEGSRGMSCFVVPRYESVKGTGARTIARGMRIHRLKDKLGTRALPSAEVGLDGAVGWPIGDPEESGIRRMMTLVQITRLHNAAAASGGMRRAVSMARAFATHRTAFGALLTEQPLHRETLTWLSVDADAAFLLSQHCFHLLGRVEHEQDAEAAAELRIAATLAKALTGKLAVEVASEAIEAFGGNGYIEDTGMPRLLRDAQVLPIWEGTTNVLSLDVLRALGDQRVDVVTPLLGAVDRIVDTARDIAALQEIATNLATARNEVESEIKTATSELISPTTQARARLLTLRAGSLLAAACLLEAALAGDERAAAVADLWIRRRLLGEDVAGLGHARFDLIVG